MVILTRTFARRNVDLVDGADRAFHRTGGDLNRITDLVLDLKVNGGFDAHLGNLRLGQGLGLDSGPTKPVQPRVLRTMYQVLSFMTILIKT